MLAIMRNHLYWLLLCLLACAAHAPAPVQPPSALFALAASAFLNATYEPAEALPQGWSHSPAFPTHRLRRLHAGALESVQHSLVALNTWTRDPLLTECYGRAAAFVEDWEKYSSLSTAASLGAYSAGASGEAPQQVFLRGSACSQGQDGLRQATVTLVCPQGEAGEAEEGAQPPLGPQGGVPLNALTGVLGALRLVSLEEAQPCAHQVVLSHPLACVADAAQQD